MISKNLLSTARQFAYQQSEKFEIPSIFQLELSLQKGQWLADELGADKDIVIVGTLLMDCMLGTAFADSKIEQHVEMSVEKTKQILDQDPDLDPAIRENILHCVQEHHGKEQFYSIESEICCNADCYRFASIEGLLGGLMYLEDMPIGKAVKLFESKADEKWGALSLDICRRELEPQYSAIKVLLRNYNHSRA